MMLLCRAGKLLLSSLCSPRAETPSVAVQERKHPRLPARGSGWIEVYVSPDLASETRSPEEAVAAGFSLVLVHGLASSEECDVLSKEASRVAKHARSCSLKTPQNPIRMPIIKMFCEESQELCDKILVRSVSRLRHHLPTLLPSLFGVDGGIGSISWRAELEGERKDPADASVRVRATSVTRDPRLVFVTGEPACNVYTAGGQFKPHEDQQALTVLVLLSERDAFVGGGTAFWSESDGPTRASPGVLIRPAAGAPTIVVRPPAGTALVFGGDVTHAGQPVLEGERTVLVASFSTRSAAPAEVAYAHQYRSRWSAP